MGIQVCYDTEQLGVANYKQGRSFKYSHVFFISFNRFTRSIQNFAARGKKLEQNTINYVTKISL